MFSFFINGKIPISKGAILFLKSNQSLFLSSTNEFSNNAYVDDKKRDWLDFKKSMAPLDIGIFPLMKKENMDEVAKEVFDELDSEFVCVYDDSGSIGRRYRRMDEIGTSFCITIDHDSVKNKDVTIREISTMTQIRVKMSELKSIVRDLLYGDLEFKKIGGKK
jgi:glycyl-tRNA synthetase